MGIKPNFMKNNIQRGEWTEARFMIRACEHGFNVSRPWGGSSRYDFAIELNGEFLRVQVKSTTWTNGAGHKASVCRTRQQLYNPKEIDFFAVYVIPEDAWYIIPAKVVVRLDSGIYLFPHCTSKRKHKYECYFEAWHLLKTARPKAKAAISSGR